MPSPQWKLLALDLDGTLVGSDGEISGENIAAVRRAREAGIKVVICTGRGLRECRRFLQILGQTEPVAVASGSIIADPISGRTLHRFSMDPALVHDVVSLMHSHGHPALVLKDPTSANLDYLVVESERRLPLDPVLHWWFGTMQVGVRHVQDLHEDEHPEHTVRIGAFGISTALHPLVAELDAVLNNRGTYHNFPAVVLPTHRQRLGPGENFHVLEIFDAAGNKWSAVGHLAATWGIDPTHTAAIGDEVNDLAMIRGAGLGVAMGNAVLQVHKAAARSTLHHDQHGVAHAIDRMLQGEW